MLASTMIWLITASCPNRECDALGEITTSGVKVVVGRTMACPPELDFGTVIYITGIGERICEDRGGKVQGRHLDVYMNDKKEADNWGRQKRRIHIISTPNGVPIWDPEHNE